LLIEYRKQNELRKSQLISVLPVIDKR